MRIFGLFFFLNLHSTRKLHFKPCRNWCLCHDYHLHVREKDFCIWSSSWASEGRNGGFDSLGFWHLIFSWSFYVKKCLSVSFELVKWYSTKVGSPWKKSFGHPWSSWKLKREMCWNALEELIHLQFESWSLKFWSTTVSGVSRVWQAWHVPSAPLWWGDAKSAWQKLKSLCIVSWTSFLRPMSGTEKG